MVEGRTLLLLAMSGLAYGEETNNDDEAPPAAFLEFLGEWVQIDERWLAPTDVVDVPPWEAAREERVND